MTTGLSADPTVFVWQWLVVLELDCTMAVFGSAFETELSATAVEGFTWVTSTDFGLGATTVFLVPVVITCFAVCTSCLFKMSVKGELVVVPDAACTLTELTAVCNCSPDEDLD